MTSDTQKPGAPNRRFHALPLGAVRPAGWLRRQIEIQAAGLTGHLDEFWPDVARSKWIGGDAEGWERAPYWLDGVVPLAFLLDDARLKAKVNRWMDFILAHQHEDGWLGPREDPHSGSGETNLDPWPVFILLRAMTQFHEATGDERVIPSALRVLRRIQTLIADRPLSSWAKMRWPELALSVYWIYQRTGESWLLDLAETAREQGYNWSDHFLHFPFHDKQPAWTMENHVVNNAMALKEPALRPGCECSTAARAAMAYIDTLDRYHGQATGVFTGDESLAGKNPSQGTELCAVVEYLFSLEKLIEMTGDGVLADRLERIAFNALPATFKPDMWAHQYDQQANQVVCRIAEPVIYTNNGADSNIYGLAPNFGCCTANMHQGWPKFAAHLWMHTHEGGLAAVSYAPCIVETTISSVPISIKVNTSYPFEELVECLVTVDRPVSFQMHLRIPGWADRAVVSVDGMESAADGDGFYCIDRTWSSTTSITLRFFSAVRTAERYGRAVSIERGPLVYSLEIREQWKQVSGELPHGDWEVYPTTPWNYALDIDLSNPERSISFDSSPPGECPFSPEGAPIHATARGRRLPGWDLESNAAAPPPLSPVESDEPLEELELIPYGCTNLRVTEFPRLSNAPGSE